jgi:D-alanyl-D-alanine dipeptidase
MMLANFISSMMSCGYVSVPIERLTPGVEIALEALQAQAAAAEHQGAMRHARARLGNDADVLLERVGNLAVPTGVEAVTEDHFRPEKVDVAKHADRGLAGFP